MKLPPLTYHRPRDIAEAVRLLSALEHAHVLAGGQSLIPMLADRRERASHLVDLAGVADLTTITLDGDELVLGAMVRHRTLAEDPVVRQHAPLLSDAAALVATPAIRNRGTLGGSLALAGPAAELVVASLVLDARIDVVGPDGRRALGAAELARRRHEAVMADDEVVTAVRIRVGQGPGAIEEVTRRTGDAPVVCVAGVRDARGGLRWACGGAAPSARRLPSLERRPSPVLADDVRAALDDDLAPVGDGHGSAAYRRHVAQHLVLRVLDRLAAGAS